jgi:hypothetical protein
MDQLIRIVAWPSVVIIIAIVVVFVFRAPIAALIGRTKKVGKGGLETFDGQPAQPTEEKKGVDEFFRTFDNPLIVEAEALIVKDLKERRIDTPADREKTLVRALAGSNIIQHFERVYGAIWGSQLTCLRYLNPRDDGVDVAELVPFYESAKANYPSWYENQPFERWLGFLSLFNLVLQRDSRVFITVAGREFLKYLVATGKSGPYHG